MLESLPILTSRLTGVWPDFLVSITLMVAISSALCLFSSQACNPGRVWWRNPGLVTDICYWLVVQALAPFMRMGLLMALAVLALAFVSQDELNDYLVNGRGPLGALPFWGQVAAYLLLSDFLLYWNHRLFHGDRLWRYHAIHHSAEEVDWTTAYRFHPVNLCFGSFLVDVVMLYIGVSPTVLLLLVPFQVTTAVFVHANLNWTFGPLKYVVATPVFHRWHHTSPAEGGSRNFAPTFAVWDVLFGTFHMPEGKLPQNYGVDDPQFPRDFLRQLIFPFRSRNAGIGAVLARPLNAPPSAIGSVGPQPGS